MSTNDLCTCGHPRGRHHIEFGCRDTSCKCGGYTRPYRKFELEALKNRLIELGPASTSHPTVHQICEMSEADLRWLHDNGAFPLGVSWRDLMRIRRGR